MSLSTPSPNSLLSRLDAAGNPYHGLFDNGTLTLPNATTMAHPAPTGSRWYMSGRSIRVQRPGWTGPTRTEDQQAADAAAGYQWLNYGIMAGDSALFYGKPLGERKWIYIDPSGVRWLAEYIIPGGQSLGTMAGSNITVRLSRFGEFGADAEVHDYSVAVPDLGQSTPDWSGFGTPEQLRDRLMDVRPDGSGALIMGYRDMGSGAGYFRDAALAFVEITLSGAGASAGVAMQLRRNRAQCVGTVTQDLWPVVSGSKTLNASSRGVVDVPAQFIFLTGSNQEEYNNISLNSCTGGYRHVGSLSFGKSTSWSDGDDPPMPPSSFDLWFSSEPSSPAKEMVEYVLSANLSAKRTDVIVSMFYAPDESLREITADIEMDWAINSPAGEFTSGGSVTRESEAQGSPGSCSVVVTKNETDVITYTKTSSVSGSVRITLKANGATCYQKTFTGQETGDYSLTVEYRASPSPSSNFPVTRASQTVTINRTYNGSPITVSQVSQNSSTWPNFSSSPPVFPDPMPAPYRISPWHLRRNVNAVFDGNGSVLTFPDLQMFQIFGNQSTTAPPLGEPIVVGGSQGSIFVQIARLGPSIIGVMESTILSGDSAYECVFIGQMATPGGLVTMPDISVNSIAGNNPYPSSPLRASYHPVTGEVVRSFSALCWV